MTAFVSLSFSSEAVPAEQTLALGVIAGASGPINNQAQAKALEQYFSQGMKQKIQVQTFSNQEDLYRDLLHDVKIQCAMVRRADSHLLSNDMISPLASLQKRDNQMLVAEVVCLNDTSEETKNDFRQALLNMHNLPEGRQLLDGMQGTCFFLRPQLNSMKNVKSQPQRQTVTGDFSSAGLTKESKTEECREPIRESQAALGAESSGASLYPDSQSTSLSTELETFNAQTPEVAGSSKGHEETVSLQADYLAYEESNESYLASGNVVLTQGGRSLAADQLLWQNITRDALAEGQVVMKEPDGRLSGHRLHYNLTTGLGQLSGGALFLRDGNFHLAGNEINKLGFATYKVEKGTFTTCNGEIPDWKFTAKHVDVTFGDYARAKHVWFHVKDLPIFYTPYLVFPVKIERSSGFLMPRYGYTDNRGTQISLAWYQVIDRHLDATVYLDYMSELGYGKGLQYRYLLGNQTYGEALVYHVSGISDFPDMLSYDWEHQGRAPGDIWLSADVQYVDNDRFFEEFGEVAEEYNKDKTVSNLWAQKNWNRLNLVGRARYIKDLETSNDTTLQRLPELSLYWSRYRIGQTPLYLSIDSQATNFTRKEGEEGRRLFLKPSVAAMFKPGSWLEFMPEFTLYERIYDADSPDDENAVPEISATISTRLNRIFDLGFWGMKRLKHSIEPNLVYTYIPDQAQGNLPLFDLNDRIPKTNKLEYALVNRFVAQMTSTDGVRSYREIMNLRFSQSYDIEDKKNGLANNNEPFSDFRVELNSKPTNRSYLKLDNLIKVHGDLEFSRFYATAGWHDGHGNGFGASYNYRNGFDDTLNSEYARLDLKTSILKPVYLNILMRYDLRTNTELEKTLNLEYRSQCWSLFFTFRDKLDEQEYFVSFALAGIGRVLGFGGMLEDRQNE